MSLESWRYRDPFVVCATMEEQRARKAERETRKDLERIFGAAEMTQDESDKVEDLLMTWYEYASRYRPALGAPRASVSCKEYQSGEVHDTGDAADESIEKYKAEHVQACVDELHYLQRAAIELHLRNKLCRAWVFRNARLGNAEEAHRKYLDAKEAIFPMLVRAGLLET